MLAGMSNGTVSHVDIRSKSRSWSKEFQATKINSIQQSPVDEYVVITAGGDCYASEDILHFKNC